MGPAGLSTAEEALEDGADPTIAIGRIAMKRRRPIHIFPGPMLEWRPIRLEGSVKEIVCRVGLFSLALLTVIGLGGCSSSERDRLMRDKYPSYPDAIRHAIDKEYLIRGMDQEQVYLARGEPICKKTIEHKGRTVEVWLFAPGGRDPCKTAEFRVYFEQGMVTGWEEFTEATRKTVPPGFVEP